ncbi:unnamed protein product [Caenorhabditis sp. 36 PRJEB53466]|nr:unnamed protein product [Caenorhabditis sp. 36 PRJEB53466]
MEEPVDEMIVVQIRDFQTFRRVASDPILVQGLPWQMTVIKRTDGSLFYKVAANEDSASSMWRSIASTQVSVRCYDENGNQIENEKSLSYEGEFDYQHNSTEGSLGALDEYTDPKRNFLKQGECLEVECRLSVIRTYGVRRKRTFNYDDEKSLLFNACLLIDGRKVYVNKQILTMHSKFFENLFYGEFKEKYKDMIELPDVKYDEFVAFLDIIHPTRAEIRETTVEILLNLADRFQTEEVLARCEDFLMNSSTMEVGRKLFIAQTYSLSALSDKCIKSYNSLSEMCHLRKSEYYNHLSNETKSALLHRLCMTRRPGRRGLADEFARI